MIKTLGVKNFRNLSLLNITFNERISIISGKNELGKSNTLNAMYWLLTGTILTDKWGTGENDIDSIIPKNAIRGINPEVSIELENGTKFSKRYVTKYSKDGEKVIGHTTEYLINDVACKNETEFNSTLYPVIKFYPRLNTKDVNELRLFTDPLYALQKLDAKQLRALLVDLGCSVTNEELYQRGFEDLRPYGEKYLGKWDVFRKYLKDTIKTITKDIENLQAKLETVASIESYDDTELKRLNLQLEELISKKTNIKNKNVNDEITELKKQIAVLESDIESKKANYDVNVQTQINALKLKKEALQQKAKNDYNVRLNPFTESINKAQLEIDKIEKEISLLDTAYQNCEKSIIFYTNTMKEKNTTKGNLALQLDKLLNSDKVICPVCLTEFVVDEEHVNREIAEVRTKIQNYNKELEQLDIENQKCLSERNSTIEKLADLKNKKIELENQVISLNQKLEQEKNKEISTEEIKQVEEEILNLNKPLDLSVENIQLVELKQKLSNFEMSNMELIQEELNNIDNNINNINNYIYEENIKKAKYTEKLEYQEQLKKNQITLNNNESLLARCNAFIQKMISLINEKATEKTGLTFVMLEENLSNDGIKEVCYATINNIPFKDVNTATKIKYGIKFIEKLKELLGSNDLPILVDRMESIDSIDGIKTMSNTEQIICTRVSNDENITII